MEMKLLIFIVVWTLKKIIKLKNYFKPAVFFLSLWPIYIIVYQLIYNKLGPEPVDRIINHFGEWTLIFILLTLSMTPLKKVTNSIEWIKFRRMLGLFAFFYASLHLLTYVGLDYRFDMNEISKDILTKRFIFVGFAAWLLLVPLALTSSKKMMSVLKQYWKKLHRLIYLIALLGVTHFIWLVKKDVTEPLIYLLIILFLLAFRVKFKKTNLS